MRGRRHDPDTQISTSPSKVLGFSSSRRTFAAEPSRTKTARAFAILFAESCPIGFRRTAKCKTFPTPIAPEYMSRMAFPYGGVIRTGAFSTSIAPATSILGDQLRQRLRI